MKKFFIAACVALTTLCAAAVNCDLMVQVANPAQYNQELSENVARVLSNRLTSACNQNGMMAADDYGQFVLVPRFATLYTDQLAGPPAQTAVSVELTLGIAGMEGGSVIASKQLELRGVGSTKERAYINALGKLSGSNAVLKEFMADAQQRIIQYFDRNYASLLSRADNAAAQHRYDEALYYATLIPSCSKGYKEATAAAQKYYTAYINMEGTKLLNAAKAAFATSPNAAGAAQAYELLGQINPSSSAYAEAMRFAAEVKRDTKKEYNFEVHKKYEDGVKLTQQQLQAMRDIGVAYGRGQKNNTTNILWK